MKFMSISVVVLSKFGVQWKSVTEKISNFALTA